MSNKQPRREFEKLLVATDFSRGAEYAVARAVRLPLARRATVQLLHVLPDDMPRKIRSRVEEKARLKLKQTASSATKVAQAVRTVLGGNL